MEQQRKQKMVEQQEEELEEMQHGPLSVEQLQVEKSHLQDFVPMFNSIRN